MYKREDFHRPEKPLEKTQEIDNDARVSKKAQMKRKLNRNQKCITLRDIQLSSLIFLFSSMRVIFVYNHSESCFLSFNSLS